MEKVWKNLQKVIQKGGKNEEKTFKKTMWKKTWLFERRETKPRSPREAPEPNKHNKSQQDTYKPSTQTPQWARKVTAKKVSEEGWVKKGDFKRPTSTI